jgi:PncC family amidohydrolase
MKEKLLGVPASILASPGPVSLEAVRQMVNGALDLFEADYALAVSGFAGPTAGATDQPVGTVWAAAGSRHEVVARELHFARSRDIIIEYAAITALALLWRFMAGKKA